MPRRSRPRAPRPSGDRDRLLAEEVLYLHSLWRCGPPVPSPPRASGSLATRKRADQRKRRRLEHLDEPHDDPGSDWPLAPSPPATPTSWPAASSSSTPLARPPPPQPSPGSLAQRAALRAAEEFFCGHASGDDEGSASDDEDDGEEERAAGFCMGLFERDAELRGYYERSCEGGEFVCLGCVGRKVRKGRARRFRDCVGLVQHARAATRCGRPRAHRALAAAVCRVLGWDIERLPSIVIDPRGTLGQALATDGAAAAASAVHDANDNVDDTGDNDGSLSDEDAAKDGDMRMSSSPTDEDEDFGTRKNDVCLSDGDAAKEDVDMENSGPSSNDNHGEIHEQQSGTGSAEKEKDAAGHRQEHAKISDCTRGTCIIRLGNSSPKGETATENKEEHANAVFTGDNDIANLENNATDSSKKEAAAKNKEEHAINAVVTDDNGIVNLGNNSIDSSKVYSCTHAIWTSRMEILD